MTLPALYSWFLNGGAALLGPALYMLLEQYAQLDTIPQKYRRPFVALLSVLLGGLFWILGAVLGFVPHPATLQDWANGIWQASISAGAPLFLTSQLTHSILSNPVIPMDMVITNGPEHPEMGKPFSATVTSGASIVSEAFPYSAEGNPIKPIDPPVIKSVAPREFQQMVEGRAKEQQPEAPIKAPLTTAEEEELK